MLYRRHYSTQFPKSPIHFHMISPESCAGMTRTKRGNKTKYKTGQEQQGKKPKGEKRESPFHFHMVSPEYCAEMTRTETDSKTKSKTGQQQQDNNQQDNIPKGEKRQEPRRTTADQIYFGDAASELSANCREIRRSPGICWMIWWIFVFLWLTGICIFHLLSNVQSFISYQTFTALREDHVDKLRIPRVTVCMSNWIQKEKFEKVEVEGRPPKP